MADEATERTWRGAALVALDWGTTSLRAWLLDPRGEVLDEARTDDGMLRVSQGAGDVDRPAAFATTFLRLCGAWLDARPGMPTLCAGMAGSNHGWVDAGYLDLPTDLTALGRSLTRVTAGPHDVHVVPGLRVTGASPDVMRGEEVQLVGALAGVPAGSGERPSAVVLPGTHTKWVRLDGTRVTTFATTMTGELYGLLTRDSILARLASGAPSAEPAAAFRRGVETEAADGDARGLLALLFTARTLVMAGRLEPHEVADYVSGLLVGADVRHALRAADGPAGPVAVCGSRPTATRYRLALEMAGVAVRHLPEDAAARGLWTVARAAGLVASAPVAPTTEESPA